jgi:hypothetical protein
VYAGDESKQLGLAPSAEERIRLDGLSLEEVVCDANAASLGAARDAAVSGGEYVGVTWDKKRGKYTGQCQAHGKNHHAGCHATALDAANDYDQLAWKLKGR